MEIFGHETRPLRITQFFENPRSVRFDLCECYFIKRRIIDVLCLIKSGFSHDAFRSRGKCLDFLVFPSPASHLIVTVGPLPQ